MKNIKTINSYCAILFILLALGGCRSTYIPDKIVVKPYDPSLRAYYKNSCQKEEDGSLATPNSERIAISKINPKFPLSMVRQGYDGWVQLTYSISAKGDVSDIELLSAYPRDGFVEQALIAVNQWKFVEASEKTTCHSVQLDFNYAKQNRKIEG